MVLGLLSSRALRSFSSRVLSTNTHILTRTIFSTPELRKPVALEAATEPGIGKISGARFHFPNSDPKGTISRFCYHDRVSISGNWRMRLIEVEKLQRSVASSLVALLPALFLGLSLTPVLAEDASTELTETDSSGSDKIDDGSVVSNLHTSKCRMFTDNGREFFLQALFFMCNLQYVGHGLVLSNILYMPFCFFFQGKLEDAERLLVSALQEAKEGFGEMDPNVASACNNLAALYRVKKAFDKAEPLYLEAINIFEKSYGHEDIRVGHVLHNLGQFYLAQKKLDGARACYERALKIKRRVLGEDHARYAMTMYHLGKDGGQGGSFLCMSGLRSLVQLCIDSNELTDAVNILRKILHAMEVSKMEETGLGISRDEKLERCLDDV